MKEKADWPSTSHSPRDHDTSHTKTVRSLLVSRLTSNNFPPPPYSFGINARLYKRKSLAFTFVYFQIFS